MCIIEICPKCKEKLYFIKEINKAVCSSTDCKYQQPYIQAQSRDIRFEKNNYLKYPWIIAYSYSKLEKFLQLEENYGLLFQIKDIFELLIKFPILIILDNAITKKLYEEKEINNLVSILLDKNLSFGDWIYIGKEILKLIDNDAIDILKFKDSDIINILKSLINLYEENKIVWWRNENIGHGVLKNQYDEDFKKDIYNKIELLLGHFEEFNEFYSSLKICYKNKNKYIQLEGINPELEELREKRNIYIYENGKYRELKYFILLKDKSIYLFDSYNKDKNKLVVSNYVNGGREIYKCEEIKKIYSKCKKMENVNFMNRPISKNGVYCKSAEKKLNEINVDKKMIRPEYINQWLDEFIETNKKGILMLKMSRGLGKTTFVQLLDPYSINKFKKQNIYVCAYYINNIYSSEVRTFKNTVIDNLRRHGNDSIAGGFISFDEKEYKSKKEELANILKVFKEIHKVNSGNEKLLLILDGLDEINDEDQQESIFDFIPNEELLEEGIYILLTSRSEKDIPNKISIDSISVQTKKEININTEENILTVKNFLKNICKVNDEDKIKKIMKVATNTFLYVTPVESLIRFNINIDDIKSEMDIFPKFLELLNKLYGEKYFNELLDILLVLAISRQNMTINEILYILNYDEVNFKVLLYIEDIKSLLLIERTKKGNTMGIAHTTFRDYLNNNYSERIKKIISNCLEQIVDEKNIFKVLDSTDNNGKYYLLCNSLYLAQKYESEYKNKILNNILDDHINELLYEKLDSEQLKILLNFLNDIIKEIKIKNKSNSLKEKLLDIYIYKICIGINTTIEYLIDYRYLFSEIENIIGDSEINEMYKINFYSMRSNYYRKIGEIKKSKNDLNILSKLNKRVDNITSKVQELLINSIHLKNINNIELSLEQSFEILKLLEDINDNGSKKFKSDAFNNIGLCYVRLKKFEEAEIYIKKSIEIIEEFKFEKSYYNKYIYTKKANLGRVLREKGEVDKSIKYYKETLKELEDYKQIERVKSIDGESLLYNGLATVYCNQSRWDESLRFYKKALEKEKEKEKDKQDTRFIEHVKRNIDSVKSINQ